MALCAIGRCVASRQGECSHVVIKVYGFTTRWVTRQTCRIVKCISRDSGMLSVCFRIGVTGGTGKNRIVIRGGMAVGTIIPRSFVFAAVDGEVLIVMIKGGGYPCCFVMAVYTFI